MGKLLFPRAEIEAWLAAGQVQNDTPAPSSPRPNVFLGSHDPLLEWALRESRSGLAAYFDGSSDGLRRFASGEGLAAGLHLFHAETQTWNTAQVGAQFADRPVVLIEWAKRQRGLILSSTADANVDGIAEIRGLRFAARQTEAGAQQLFNDLAQEAGLTEKDVVATAEMRTETDAALAVLEGKADVSFGLQSLAAQYRLRFVPIIEERYDLLVDRRAWFEAPMQTLLQFCTGAAFKRHAKALAGYDVSKLGQVHFNGR